MKRQCNLDPYSSDAAAGNALKVMKAALMGLLLMSSQLAAESFLIVALDYDIEQECQPGVTCVGLIDRAPQVTYNLEQAVIDIETESAHTCIQDGIFRDRFQPSIQIRLNGDSVGMLKEFSYDVANGIITVKTHELNFAC